MACSRCLHRVDHVPYNALGLRLLRSAWGLKNQGFPGIDAAVAQLVRFGTCAFILKQEAGSPL